jgi:hypothetical protein
MFSYLKAAMERAMKVQEVILRPWRRRSRGGKQRRSSASATGTCGAGANVNEEFGYDGLFDRPSRANVVSVIKARIRKQHRDHPQDTALA